MAIEMVCGLPGSGKSYYMTSEILSALKKNRPVFCNYPIKNCYQLTFDDLCYSSFPEGSLLCIDEANSWFRARDWAKLPREVFSFFMHHRHFKLDMIIISQIPTTVDVNIRDIVSWYIWSRSFRFPFSERVSFFKYDYYYSIDDLSAFRNSFTSKIKKPSSKVFSQFDSYYKFVEMQRKENPLLKW